MTAVAPPAPETLPPLPESAISDPAVPNALAVESLVASIGLEPFVTREFTTVHGHHITRAEGMHDEIARKIHRFLMRDDPEPAAPLPPFDFKQVATDLEAPVLPEHVQREIAAFGQAGDLALQANLVVQRIRAYVESKVPKRVYMSIFGPEPGEPPKSDVARFRRLWVIACDPLSILDDLNEFNVSRDQVKACSEMYPLVYATFWPITQAQRVRRAGVDPNWKLSRKKENILRVLTKQEDAKIPLARALQAIFAEDAAAMAPPPTQGPSRPSGNKDEADSQSTPSQRIDAT